MAVLGEEEREAALGGLPGWSWVPERGGISRSFRFRDFAEAFGFMTHVALLAEKADHHPEWSNVWNRVVMDLATHDAAGITERDFALAEAVNRFAPA